MSPRDILAVRAVNFIHFFMNYKMKKISLNNPRNEFLNTILKSLFAGHVTEPTWKHSGVWTFRGGVDF